MKLIALLILLSFTSAFSKTGMSLEDWEAKFGKPDRGSYIASGYALKIEVSAGKVSYIQVTTAGGQAMTKSQAQSVAKSLKGDPSHIVRVDPQYLSVQIMTPDFAEEFDLDNPETLKKILEKAISRDKLQLRGPQGEELVFEGEFLKELKSKSCPSGEELFYEVGSEIPLTGWFKRVYPNGKVHYLGRAKEGKQDGPYIEWNDNGQKKDECTFKDGKIEGVFTRWHDNGQKEAEATFKDGKAHGVSLSWWENGQKSEEKTFKDGKPEGVLTAWNRKGEKIRELTFKDGKRIRDLRFKDGKLQRQ